MKVKLTSFGFTYSYISQIDIIEKIVFFAVKNAYKQIFLIIGLALIQYNKDQQKRYIHLSLLNTRINANTFIISIY
jgi:hypothetical protein